MTDDSGWRAWKASHLLGDEWFDGTPENKLERKKQRRKRRLLMVLKCVGLFLWCVVWAAGIALGYEYVSPAAMLLYVPYILGAMFFGMTIGFDAAEWHEHGKRK